MRGISIRLRLTLLYSAILAVTLIVFSLLLYVTQARATYDSIRTDLQRQVERFSRTNELFPGPGAPPPEASLPSGTLPGRWTQTRGINGDIIAHSLDLSGTSVPLSEAGLRGVQSGSVWVEIAQVEEQPALIYSQRYTTRDGSVQIVQIAYPIAQAQSYLNALRLILLAGSSLAIMLAFALGWVLAGAALRPIHRITQTAQAIGAEHNFSRRVDHEGPADEVGQLAVTFNDMLAELETAYRQLEDTLESQKRFVADASHELRTPLTTVRGNIELLRRDPPIASEERTEIMADTTDEVDRLIRLVNQLLQLARADAGQELQREVFPIKPLLEDVCRQAKLLAQGCTIACKPAPDLLVQGDRDALKQVLLVLVDNATTHSTPGTVVEIAARQTDDAIILSVRDNGPGIPPDMLPHIFERFYRGEVSRSGPGAGLGLAIAKELVEAQEGTIRVESTPGKGSLFTVILPAATLSV
jgi:two-component system OmpR family sensor kinase